MNRIGCISVNYRSAPVEIREKLFVNPQDFQCILSLIHISEPTRLLSISYAVFCLKKKNHTYHTPLN